MANSILSFSSELQSLMYCVLVSATETNKQNPNQRKQNQTNIPEIITLQREGAFCLFDFCWLFVVVIFKTSRLSILLCIGE